MIARKFGRIVNITSGAVKAPIEFLGLSNGARSGLTGFVAGLARKRRAAQRDDQQPAAGAVRHRSAAHDDGVARESAGQIPRETLLAGRAANPAGRFGTIEEFGAACAFLCSVHAGYVVGQNLLLDGGQYPGTF